MDIKEPGRVCRLVCCAAVLMLLLTSTAFGQGLNLMTPAIANVSGVLTARFGVTVEERPALRKGLENGAKLVLKSRVRLFRVKDYWMDSLIAASNYESVLQYEPLSKEFILTLPGHHGPLRSDDLFSLISEGWAVIEASLCPWSELVKGEHYSLRMDISMNEADAPDGLSGLLYFWSWNSGANNTFELDFIY